TLYRLERYPEAQELLRKAVEIRKNRPECRQDLADTYDWLSDVERALGNAAAAEECLSKRAALLDRLAAEDN
ncbi:MAG: cytochrome P450, partial [Oscillospiraceae bacterium]|nr:cytochrome P450 [Oscillospiraceae bacterium]